MSTHILTMAEIACPCGFVSLAPEHWVRQKRNTGQGFTCMGCGGPLAFQPTELERLRAEVETTKQNVVFWQKRAREEEEAKSKVAQLLSKVQKRVGNGVCPCCHRAFVNMQRHMASKHPEMASDTTIASHAGAVRDAKKAKAKP